MSPWGRLVAWGATASLRRVVLVSHAFLTCIGVVAVLALGRPDLRLPAALGIGAIYITADGWLALRPRLSGWEWLYPGGVAPLLACGIACAATGIDTIGLVAMLGTPVACAGALFEAPVVIGTWIGATVTCFVLGATRGTLGAAAVNAAMFALVQAVAGWITSGRSPLRRLARLASLERHLNDPEVMLTADGRLVYANDRTAESYGHSIDELRAMNIADVMVRPDLFKARLPQILEHGALVFESEHRRRSGESFPVEVSARACEIDGRTMVHAIIRDISARRAAEAEGCLWSTLVAQLPDAVIVTDPDYNIRQWSGGATRIYGYAAEEVRGQSLFDIIEERPSVIVGKAANVQTWTGADGRPARRKDGSELMATLDVAPLRNCQGELTGALVVSRDITSEHAAIEALRVSEERHRTVIQAISEGLILFGPDGSVVTCNPSVARILGRPMAAIAGQHLSRIWGELHDADGRAIVPEALPGRIVSLTGQSQRDVLLSVSRPDGSTAWISVNAEPIGDFAPHAVVVSVTDVTRQHQDAEQLRSALAAEQRFVAHVSHEIRTPLNGVVGFLDLIGTTALTAEARAWHESARTSARHLRSLIDDVLDVSKIDAGQIELTSAPFNLGELLTDCVTITSTRVAPDVALRRTLPRTAHFVVGDATRVRQIVLNLLSNAAKFTKRGHIELRASVDDRLDNRSRITIDIEDTGVGIPPARLAGLFSAFRQAHAASYGGTGLGLFVSRSLARMMGGDVVVSSREGQGSRFTVTLDLARGALLAPPHVRSPSLPTPIRALAGLRVLVVDDTPMNVEVVSQLLRVFFGITCDRCGDGASAVERVSARTYDLVLMDLNMPGMSGDEATRRIRALGHDVRIVALTASALSDDVARAQKAGMNGYLTKPVRPPDLAQVLGEMGTIRIEVGLQAAPYP